MIYRLATEADAPAINKFCDEHNLPHPILAICFLAETDTGELIAYANAGFVGFIESFGADNPLAGHRLYDMIQGAIAVKMAGPVFAGVINPEAGKLLERLGYEEVKNTRFYMKRN